MTKAKVARARSAASRFFTSPVVHVLAIAALVYAATEVKEPELAAARHDPIAIDAAQYQQALEAWRSNEGREPSTEEHEVILDRLAAEEALYRRALELRLERGAEQTRMKQIAELVAADEDHGASVELMNALKKADIAAHDPVMRTHLIQTMRMVARKVDVPDEMELRSFFADERARFGRPPMVEIEHVFFSVDTRGERAFDEAKVALSILRKADAAKRPLGDRFNSGNRLPLQTVPQVQAKLGSQVVAAIQRESGDEWFGPVRSPYGWHVVRVKRRAPAQTPPLATIASEVLHTYLQVKGQAQLAQTLRSLRNRYGIEVR